MGKKKKTTKTRDGKRDRAEPSSAERDAAEQAALRRQRAMRIAAIAIPVATLLGAVPTWTLADAPRAAALIGLLGVGVWIPVLLGNLGASVRPRDRTRAGSIDFGQRR